MKGQVTNQMQQMLSRTLLFVACLVFCFLSTGCVGRNCGPMGTGEVCVTSGPELVNARFEVTSTSQPFHQTQTLWMSSQTDPSKRTRITSKWDNNFMVFADHGESCFDEAGNYVKNPGCERCDFCTITSQFCDSTEDWAF